MSAKMHDLSIFFENNLDYLIGDMDGDIDVSIQIVGEGTDPHLPGRRAVKRITFTATAESAGGPPKTASLTNVHYDVETTVLP